MHINKEFESIVKERDELKLQVKEFKKVLKKYEKHHEKLYEYFPFPENCGKCKFISHYEYGSFARNPHCCCELLWLLEKEDHKVNENTFDEDCPLKNIHGVKYYEY